MLESRSPSSDCRTMTTLPPNQPNRDLPRPSKEAPYDGQRRREQSGETMDVMGDMRDSPVVVAMFLVGVVAWFLRERCIC